MAIAAPTSTNDEAGQPEVQADTVVRCLDALRQAVGGYGHVVDGRGQRVQIVTETGHRLLQLDERRVGRGQLISRRLQLHAEVLQLGGDRLEPVGDAAADPRRPTRCRRG